MQRIKRSALVNYSAGQMYKLANDVLSYPKFLPGCVSSRIIEQTDTTMTASIDVAKMGIRKTFTTSNQMVKDSVIDMTLVDGPFRTLQGGWLFTPLGDDACRIEFNLEFEFSSKLIEIAFGRIFQDLALNMVQAFTKRAKEIYGC
ncbi:SRPBCC family protein [Pragia fontium]|uniref:Ribosome association toxin PasT (RatA) of the RatAB toxin-antitoxin module n=2 Tax=Pragia fontium TaxID=82985 RepID=A0AAJ5BFM3_9GAMM|nr:SRPBCC family protein [Pragia fontium]AKJ41565.1 cyclase [Pragia fontium]SFB95799.1 Ribosome association toxin PasT (RatA) of the RatAB toxin-antitoxin module [Pragia fontium DSM 5563 = ATCC 49100]SUB81783.1 Ribosome association toxin RatA [Pragia fontium]VEJ54327.1 Ribosome association toxin RatA [Pragia fontium]GKX63082.1 ubiquinone-binding protein [Pragia fontium]